MSEWSNRALMFMATYAYGFAELDPAVDAVHKLAQLARRALGPQGEADMTWNVRNDPPCAAAFALGRSEMAEALTAERAAQEQAEALLRECESAILAAIVDEDGLDAKRGWALCDRIRATLAVPPEAPCD
ncbi:hypothetical protein [Humibacter sp.]|uniref:hypothetical protein n=1 Tax=Humibacter sp. TaxID=1940291 RepID=UPI003F7DA8F8